VFELESDYFAGSCYIVIDGVPNAPKEIFKNRARKFQYVIQGKFKRSIPFMKLYAGNAMSSALPAEPPAWLINTLRPVMSGIQPGMKFDFSGNEPYVLSPLMALMQSVAITPSGQEAPDITNVETLKDDLVALDKDLFKNMSASKRKKYFSTRANLAKYEFDTESTYTFSFYEHLVRLDNFKLGFGLLSVDLFQVLGKRYISMQLAVLWDPETDSPDGTSRRSSEIAPSHRDSKEEFSLQQIPASTISIKQVPNLDTQTSMHKSGSSESLSTASQLPSCRSEGPFRSVPSHEALTSLTSPQEYAGTSSSARLEPKALSLSLRSPADMQSPESADEFEAPSKGSTSTPSQKKWKHSPKQMLSSSPSTATPPSPTKGKRSLKKRLGKAVRRTSSAFAHAVTSPIQRIRRSYFSTLTSPRDADGCSDVLSPRSVTSMSSSAVSIPSSDISDAQRALSRYSDSQGSDNKQILHSLASEDDTFLDSQMVTITVSTSTESLQSFHTCDGDCASDTSPDGRSIANSVACTADNCTITPRTAAMSDIKKAVQMKFPAKSLSSMPMMSPLDDSGARSLKENGDASETIPIRRPLSSTCLDQMLTTGYSDSTLKSAASQPTRSTDASENAKGERNPADTAAEDAFVSMYLANKPAWKFVFHVEAWHKRGIPDI
jgi:hypothetical protein